MMYWIEYNSFRFNDFQVFRHMY